MDRFGLRVELFTRRFLYYGRREWAEMVGVNFPIYINGISL